MDLNEKAQEKVVDLVTRLVERGDAERAELIAAVQRRVGAGEDAAAVETGFDWRAWAIHFAHENPRYVMFAPVSAICWLYLIYQLVIRG